MYNEAFEVLVLSVYVLSLVFLVVYGLGQLHLTLAYLKKPKAPKIGQPDLLAEEDLPFVSIQLPVYNEKTVITRLLESMAAIDYPRDRFEVQLLDDSTDDSYEIAKEVIKTLPRDLKIDHIRRSDRSGFKAGALKHGMESVKGEFITIFDADFLPQPDFLRETLPQFQNPEIGVVQTRWGHLNQEFSLLTSTQAFGLDAHFTVEQRGRNLENCFVSFNGTAGVWRKQCIEEAGGWQSDTLTEDLDLSYRAQLKGWKFMFLEDVVSPAELPITVEAYKSQQYRWNKGAAETHKKVWKDVWSSALPAKIKFHALLQLSKGFGFVASFLLTVVSVPVLYLKSGHDNVEWILSVMSFSLVCVPILILFYYSSLGKLFSSRLKRFKYFATRFPTFMAISLGTSLHNTLAVIEGYIGFKTPFVRTPKFNIRTGSNQKLDLSLPIRNVSWLTFIEGALSIYFALAAGYAFKVSEFTFLPFHLLLAFGYAFIFVYSIAQQARFAK